MDELGECLLKVECGKHTQNTQANSSDLPEYLFALFGHSSPTCSLKLSVESLRCWGVRADVEPRLAATSSPGELQECTHGLYRGSLPSDLETDSHRSLEGPDGLEL